MAHEPTKANQLLVALRAGPSEEPLEPSDHDFRRIAPSLCVPELPRTYQRLEQLFEEGFVITAMSPHPNNQILVPFCRGLLVAMKRG